MSSSKGLGWELEHNDKALQHTLTSGQCGTSVGLPVFLGVVFIFWHQNIQFFKIQNNEIPMLTLINVYTDINGIIFCIRLESLV